MKNGIIALFAAVLVGLGLVAAGLADNGNDTPKGGGHTPVTICHKPGTPAEQTLVVDDDSVELTGHLGHGDTLGACPEEPPVDTTPTDTTPTDTTPTDTTPTDTTPGETHDCVYVGADKDGGVDAYGGTNDDCAPAPSTTPEVTTSTPTQPASEPPAAGPAPTTAPSKPKTKPKAKPPKPHKQKTTKKAAKKSTKVVKVQKKSHGVVVVTTADGRKHLGVMGSG